MNLATIFWVSVVFLLYVYIGYPVIMALIAYLYPKPEYNLTDYPQVTLIIAAYNESAIIQEKLNNALNLDYPSMKLEIIVAADGSTDDTTAIVKEFESRGVKLSYSAQRQGKLAAISRAVKHASGDILVFSDANNFYSAYSLKYLIQPFINPKVGATTGAKHIRSEGDALSSSEGLYWKYESWIKKNESRVNTCTAAAGEILAVRKELFPKTPPGVINDDFYILLNIIHAGFRVLYVSEAESWERVSQSEQDEIKRRTRITAGRFQALTNFWKWMPWNNPGAIWQIISHKYFRLFIPFAMLLGLITNLILVINQIWFQINTENWVLWMMAAQISFYLCAILGSWINLKGPWKVLYIPVFLVNSNLASLRGFFRHLTQKQEVSWEKVNRR